MIEYADVSLHEITCDEAWLYCATLTHNNEYDWRMPSYDERIAENGLLPTWDLGDYINMSRVSEYNIPWHALPRSWRIHRYQVIPVRDIL